VTRPFLVSVKMVTNCSNDINGILNTPLLLFANED